MLAFQATFSKPLLLLQCVLAALAAGPSRPFLVTEPSRGPSPPCLDRQNFFASPTCIVSAKLSLVSAKPQLYGQKAPTHGQQSVSPIDQ